MKHCIMEHTFVGSKGSWIGRLKTVLCFEVTLSWWPRPWNI